MKALTILAVLLSVGCGALPRTEPAKPFQGDSKPLAVDISPYCSKVDKDATRRIVADLERKAGMLNPTEAREFRFLARKMLEGIGDLPKTRD